MSDVKISDLPLGTANANAVVPADNADSTATEKIKLGDIANLAFPEGVVAGPGSLSVSTLGSYPNNSGGTLSVAGSISVGRNENYNGSSVGGASISVNYPDFLGYPPVFSAIANGNAPSVSMNGNVTIGSLGGGPPSGGRLTVTGGILNNTVLYANAFVNNGPLGVSMAGDVTISSLISGTPYPSGGRLTITGGHSNQNSVFYANGNGYIGSVGVSMGGDVTISPVGNPSSGGNLTVNGQIILGSGGSVKFPDNTTQTTAYLGDSVVSLGTVSGNISTDASLGKTFDLTLSSSGTLTNPTNPVNGKIIRWRITYSDNNIPLTLGSKFNIPTSASSPLPFSTVSGVTDHLVAMYHSGRDKWDVISFTPGY